MNFFTWVVYAASGLLSNLGVDFGPEPVPGPTAETVMLVIYYSDGDFDFKGVGEKMLIHTGEQLQVNRNRIRPESPLITSDWNRVYGPKVKAPPQAGTVPILLDRKNGIACLAKKCATLYAICPHDSALDKGQKCVSYSRK